MAQLDIGLSIAFTGKRQHSIWPGFHAATDLLGEMHTQKGKAWIGYWVDETTHQPLTFRR